MGKSKISDVAQAAGVSKSTVSNYLNGRYDNMSVQTRENIKNAIAELDYVPNISARRLSAKAKSRAVCVIIPTDINRTFESYYYTTVLGAIGRLSAELGYKILIYIRNGRNMVKELAYLKGMASTIVDGFIIFDLETGDHYFKEFERAKIPYSCVGKFLDYHDYNYVASDHATTVLDSVEHLVGLGHRRIAMIHEGDTSVVTTVRVDAYRKALELHGIPFHPQLMANIDIFSGIHSVKTHETCAGLLFQQPRPTAVIAPVTALPGIERVAEERGLRIGVDLSVIVLDYMEEYNLRQPNYTRFPSRAADVTEIAFRKLLKYIENRKEGFQSEILPLSLVQGDTTTTPATDENGT